jgi:hypothetical protein
VPHSFRAALRHLAASSPEEVPGEDDCQLCNDDDDGDECEGCEHDGEDGGATVSTNCQATGVRACFSSSQIRGLFDGNDFPSRMTDATITGTLSNGQTFTATIGSSRFITQPFHGREHSKFQLAIRPNPMNPKPEITFTITRASEVRVAIYDSKGRLVKTVLNEGRTPGDSGPPG